MSESQSKSKRKLEALFVLRDKWAFGGGLFTIVLAVGMKFLVGKIYSSHEARVLLNALIDPSLYLGSAMITGSGTILALMLTILGLARRVEKGFDRAFYKQVKRISTLSTVALIGSIFTMLCMTVPLDKADNVPAAWFTIIYYALSTAMILLSGLLITIALMLMSTVSSIITVFAPEPED